MEHEARITRLESDVTELADTLLGSLRSELEGGGRNTDGLRHQVANMRVELGEFQHEWSEHVTNGGMPAKFVSASLDRTTQIKVAVIGVVGVVMSSFIGGLFVILVAGK